MTPLALVAALAALSLALLARNDPKLDEVALDPESEKLVEEFLGSHTIDSAESDEEVVARIRREVAEGKIRRNPLNGDVTYHR